MATHETRTSNATAEMNPTCVLRSLASSFFALSFTTRAPEQCAVWYTLVYRCQQGFQLRGRHRLRVEKTLGLNTAGPLQEVELCPCFHALGDSREIESAGEADDGRDEARRGSISGQAVDERSIDFQRVHRHVRQAAQGGIAGTEVIDRHAHARTAQRPQLADLIRIRIDEQALGDLQVQPPTIVAPAGDNILDELREAGASQLQRRAVHRHMHWPQTSGLPAFAFGRGSMKRPFTNADDHAG